MHSSMDASIPYKLVSIKDARGFFRARKICKHTYELCKTFLEGVSKFRQDNVGSWPAACDKVNFGLHVLSAE